MVTKSAGVADGDEWPERNGLKIEDGLPKWAEGAVCDGTGTHTTCCDQSHDSRRRVMPAVSALQADTVAVAGSRSSPCYYRHHPIYQTIHSFILTTSFIIACQGDLLHPLPSSSILLNTLLSTISSPFPPYLHRLKPSVLIHTSNLFTQHTLHSTSPPARQALITPTFTHSCLNMLTTSS